MNSKISNIIFYIMFVLLFNSAWSAKKIQVERYEHWNHPVLNIFDKYGVSLYKVSYSHDGKCPTFYAKFKYSPDTRAPDAAGFEKLYFEALKANSYYPYALVNEEENMRINVGFEKGDRGVMVVEMSPASSVSTCKYRVK